ncbi:hypothetical protein BGZ70_008707 [Mortierella alpina]|uniref:Uncharacterized protein n=1 Tax=Mortierella alpina TaxID=64518 RepID=A0A9P6J2T4_MORAP|nr:hypothetical protein BGZ70_008707 [Mortierella alpina]
MVLNPLLILIPVVLTVVVLVTVLLSSAPSLPKIPTVAIPTPIIPLPIPSLVKPPLKIVAPIIQPIATSDELSPIDPEEEVPMDDIEDHDDEDESRHGLHHDGAHHDKVQAIDIDPQEDRPNFEFKTPSANEDTQDVLTKVPMDEKPVLKKREAEDEADKKVDDDAPIYKAENVGKFALEHLIQEIVGLQSASVEKDLYKIISDSFKSDEGVQFEDIIRDLAFSHFSQQLQHQKTGKDQVQATFNAQESSIISGFMDMLVQPFIAQVRTAIRSILASICNGVADAESIQEISDPDIIPKVFACLKGNLDKFMSQVGTLLAGRLGEGRESMVKQLMELTTSLPLSEMPFPEAEDEKKVDDGTNEPLAGQSVDPAAEDVGDDDEDEDSWKDESMETAESDRPRQETFVNWLVDKVLDGLKTASEMKGAESESDGQKDDVQPLQVAEQAH